MIFEIQSANSSKTRARWNEEQDAFLLEKLVACKGNGMKTDGSSFKPSAWAMVTAALNEEFGVCYAKQQLKSRYGILRSQYNTWMELCNSPDFGFDEEKQVPTAPAELWVAYVAKNPKAGMFRYATLRNESSLDELFYGNLAVGAEARGSGEGKAVEACLPPSDLSSAEWQDLSGDDEAMSRASSSSPAPFPRRIQENAAYVLAAAIDRASDALAYPPSQTHISLASKILSSMEEAQEVTAEEVMAVADRMIENHKKAELFCGFSKPMRLVWIKKQLDK